MIALFRLKVRLSLPFVVLLLNSPQPAFLFSMTLNYLRFVGLIEGVETHLLWNSSPICGVVRQISAYLQPLILFSLFQFDDDWW